MASSQKFKSILDLVSKKADHSVLRLLQISQQHIESQLDRVGHERELWKEVVDKRAQETLQLALTLKDQQTGQALQASGGLATTGPAFGPPFKIIPRLSGDLSHDMTRGATMPVPIGSSLQMMGGVDQTGALMKASPLAKRIKPPQGVPSPKG